MPGWYVHMEAAALTAQRLRDANLPTGFPVDPVEMQELARICHKWRKALRQGRRPHARVLALDEEGLDVLPPHVGDPPRPSAPAIGEERLELFDRLRVGHDR